MSQNARPSPPRPARMRRLREPGVALLMAGALAVAGFGAGIARAGDRGATSSGKPKHTVRVGVGIAGVLIGMTTRQVLGKLGRPRDVNTRTYAFGPGDLVTFEYRKLGVLFWRGAPRTPSGSLPPDQKLRVASINTTRRSEGTKSGAGIGSTETAVKSRVSGVRCETLLGYEVPALSWRNCHVGRYDCDPPAWALEDNPCRVSAFVLRRGRVFRIAVGWLGSPAGSFE